MEMPPRHGIEGQLDKIVGSLTAANVIPFEPSHKQFEESLQERERRFRELLGALPAAVYTTDAAGRITYFNEAAAELWGHRPQLGTSEWCGSWKLYWADGTPLPHDQCPMAIALKENRPVRGAEAIAERPDGTRVPFIPYPTPLLDEHGKLVGAVNMLVDITERKQAEERQELLLRELHHRVKNTLATVQAIMGSTARASSTIEDFQTAFAARIGSLSRTHLLLTEDVGDSVPFKDLLCNELDAFDDGTTTRLALEGPAVNVPSKVAVPLAMAIHELTTNAAKYGSLSVFGGSVAVTWSVNISAEGRTLRFVWVEKNGPHLTRPKREGFGTKILTQVLAAQIQAKVTLDYRPKGLHARVVVPLPPDEPA
jgi:PAS domain S-box-containing protein